MTDDSLQREELENEILNIVARSGYSVSYDWLVDIIPEYIELISLLIQNKYLALFLDENNNGVIKFTKLGLTRLFSVNQNEAVIDFATYMKENNVSTLELCDFLAEDVINSEAIEISSLTNLRLSLEDHKALTLDKNKKL